MDRSELHELIDALPDAIVSRAQTLLGQMNAGSADVGQAGLSELIPRIFLSYCRPDRLMATRLRDDLQQAGTDCWVDTTGIRAHDRFRQRILRKEIPNRNLFVAFISLAYLESEWCNIELQTALQAERERRVDVALLVDSQATFASIPSEIKDEYQCDVLDEYGRDESYHRAVLRLAGAAWASLQSVQQLVEADDHIRAGANIFDEPGNRQADLLQNTRKHVVLAASNLRGWLSNADSRDGLVALANRGVKVSLIMSNYEAMRHLSHEGEQHLRQSVRDVQEMLTRVTPEGGGNLKAYFHEGATTLSAVFVDPEEPDSRLFFTPRWATQVVPEERMTCVIDKRINSPRLFRAIYGSVLNMTQSDAKSIDQMIAEL